MSEHTDRLHTHTSLQDSHLFHLLSHSSSSSSSCFFPGAHWPTGLLPVRSCPWLSMQQYPFPYFFSLAAFLFTQLFMFGWLLVTTFYPISLQYPQRISQGVRFWSLGGRWEQWPRQLRLTCGKFWTKPGGRVQFLSQFSMALWSLVLLQAGGGPQSPPSRRLMSYMFR